MLDSELRERAEAAGMDIGELEELCVDYAGVVEALRLIATAEAENELQVAPASDDEEIGVGRGRWRRQAGPSIVLSIRFDHDEYDELRRRAEAQGMGMSVLARTFIRKSLGTSAVQLLD